ncbi:MAG: DUF1330 domain-containing protein [Anaerolineae bacterium]|nr:DUF1330 domain-containing protein [Anaerolineae bacterium]
MDTAATAVVNAFKVNFMTVYLIIDITVTDKELYTQYITAAKPVIVYYGGKYLVRGGKIMTVTGDWHPERIVVIAFPDRDTLHQCFTSEEYRLLAPLRERSTESRSIIVDGYIITEEVIDDQD